MTRTSEGQTRRKNLRKSVTQAGVDMMVEMMSHVRVDSHAETNSAKMTNKFSPSLNNLFLRGSPEMPNPTSTPTTKEHTHGS